MTVYRAPDIDKAIEEALVKDQGKLFRFHLKEAMLSLDDAYRQDEGPFRSHMGASGLGRECAREILYSFRWATAAKHSGRALRIFNRGHLEEGRFIAMMKMIGVQIYQYDENGKQFRISHAGGHVGGAGDGIGMQVPGFPADMAVLLEFKTLSTKYAEALEKNGVQAEKFEHYVQMCIYMRKFGLAVALYMSVDKNTDGIYSEIVPANDQLADEYLERGRKLVFYEGLPERLSDNPSWYKCKFCDHHPVCHKKKAPERNCRTCMFARPQEDGTWTCTNLQSPNAGTINSSVQYAACPKYYRLF
jgi:hypothetical protein